MGIQDGCPRKKLKGRVMKKLSGIAVFGLLCWFQVSGQVLDTLWSKDLSAIATNSSYAVSLARTVDGGVIIGGGINYVNSPSWIIKTDADGKIAWSYVSTTIEPFFGIFVADNQNCFFVNASSLIKVDPNGSVIWKKGLPFSTQNFSGNVCASQDGGFFISGKSPDSSGAGITVLKFDNAGNEAWDEVLSLPTSGLTAMAPGPVDGAFLLVRSTLPSPLDSLSIIALNNFGMPLWSKTLNPDPSNLTFRVISFVKTNENRYILPGYQLTYFQSQNARLMWLDAQGKILKDSIYFTMTPSPASPLLWEYFNSVAQISPSAYLVCGTAGFALMDSSGALTNQFKLTGANFAFSSLLIVDKENFFAAINKKLYKLKINHPPYFQSKTQNATKEFYEDQMFKDSVSAVDSFPGDKLYYSVLSSNARGLTVDSLKGILSWLPTTDADSGIHTVMITVHDRVGQKDTLKYLFHIIAVNDTPSIKGIRPLKTVYYEGDTVTCTADIVDEENGPFKYIWIINGKDTLGATPAISFTPDYSSAGKCPITVIVIDGSITVKCTDTIEILNKPLPPDLSNPSNTCLTMNSFLTWGWYRTVRDPNLDTSSLRYSLEIQKSSQSTWQNALRINSIMDSMIQLKDVSGMDSLMGYPIQIRVSCSDARGYSTGWNAPRSFLLVADTLVKKAIAAFNDSGMAVFSFGREVSLSFHVVSGNFTGFSISVNYYGYIPSPIAGNKKTVYFDVSSTLKGDFEAIVLLSHDSLTADDIFALNDGGKWGLLTATTHNGGTSIGVRTKKLTGSWMTIKAGVLNTSRFFSNRAGAPESFVMYPRRGKLIIGIPYLAEFQVKGELSVFAMHGKCVLRYPPFAFSPGYYTIDCSNVPAGKYIASMLWANNRRSCLFSNFK
jgi:hypothetical protein